MTWAIRLAEVVGVVDLAFQDADAAVEHFVSAWKRAGSASTPTY
jgi:hypothetical protein